MKIGITTLCIMLTSAAFGQNAPGQTKAPAVEGKAVAVQAQITKVIPPGLENTPLGEVLKTIKSKTITQTPPDSGLAIFVDPKGLAVAGATLATPITYKSEEDEKLGEAMTYLLGADKLKYEIDNGLFLISVTPNRFDFVDRRKKSRAIQEKLQVPVELHFKNAPLEDVLKFVKQATRGPNDSGLPILVDTIGLQGAEKTMTSPVSIDSKDNESLASSLGRLLNTLGMI